MLEEGTKITRWHRKPGFDVLLAKYRCRLGASSGKLVTDECAQLEHNTSASKYIRELTFVLITTTTRTTHNTIQA